MVYMCDITDIGYIKHYDCYTTRVCFIKIFIGRVLQRVIRGGCTTMTDLLGWTTGSAVIDMSIV